MLAFILIANQPHDYTPISELLKFRSLSEHRDISSCRFINLLINVTSDAPNLLERLSIRVPNTIRNTRLQDIFYLPACRTYLIKNAPLIIKMMSIAITTTHNVAPRTIEVNKS